MSKLHDQNQTFLDIEVEISANRGLFADHYLEDILPKSEAWKNCNERAGESLKKLRKIYSRHAVHFSNNTNEPQTEHDFIQPVLNVLWGEDQYQVQCAIKVPDGHRQTDYSFFETAEQRHHAGAFKGDGKFWSKAVALGDAKKWSDSLDKRRASDGSPSNQILNYLYFAKVRWGILTNGRIWRLYEQDKSRQGGIYYEVNLEDALKKNDIEAFKRFYLFFRREAFVRDSQTGKCFIDVVYDRSIDYATKVSDRLKDSVYDALRRIMNGFLMEKENSLDVKNAGSLKLLHQQSLILLYRILFVLYAEDRALLDTENGFYKEISLRNLQRKINKALKSNSRSYSNDSFQLWKYLQRIFDIVDKGLSTGSSQHIPAFNGGLFSTTNYPYLSAKEADSGTNPWKIGDESIAWAIDLLAYSHDHWDQPGEGDIDYTSLDVRHLGSIYEGLLELQPAVATETLIEVFDAEAKTAVFKRALEHANAPKIKGQNPRIISCGEIYLSTNRGERHSTGSYYTPKYIVDYIVERTVLPLLHSASVEARALKSSVSKHIRKLDAEHKLELQSYEVPTESIRLMDPYTRAKLDEKASLERNHNERIQRQKWKVLEPFLSLRILDPAMGSGHFLVGVADFMSLYLATEPTLFNPDELGAGPAEDPQLFYKRLVVERCLYGVDLNPLAVELAKLSLWLHSISGDRALSFLDHHLRCGNSMIGASLEKDLNQAPPILLESGKRKKVKNTAEQEQFPFAAILKTHQLERFLQVFHQIVDTVGGDAEIERNKHQLFREMDDLRHQYRQIANTWLSPFFGGACDEALYSRLIDIIDSENSHEWLQVVSERDFDNAQQIAERHRFFHWELEFPEVLLEGSIDERGFDVVLGNPPYVRQELLGKEMKQYLADGYASYSGVADLYVYFMEKAHQLLRKNGRFGMITSNKYMRSKYGSGLRNYLEKHCKIETIVDFGELPVFEDAATFPSILISEHETVDEQSFGYAAIKTLEFDQLETEVSNVETRLDTSALKGSSWSLAGGVEQAIFSKMRDGSVPLGQFLPGGIKYGIKTGLNEAFVIDGATRDRLIREHASSAELIKPFAVGDDIRKYRIEQRDRWLIRIPSGWTKLQSKEQDPEEWIEQVFPAVYGWLKNHEEKAKKRWDKGEYWWELRPCDYYEYFEKPKIVYPVIAKEPRFSFSESELYSNDKTFILDSSDLSLLGILNSNLVWLYLKRNCSCLGDPDKGGRIELRDVFLRDLPVAPSTDRSFGEVVKELLSLNKTIRQERSGFWRWLDTTFGIDFQSFKVKRKALEAYELLEFKKFVAALRNNVDSAALDLDRRETQQTLYEEWQASVNKLEDATGKIQKLERELNQKVYQLYQLTDEEIAYVEDNVNG